MLFDVKDVIVDTSGAIQATLKWDNISQKLPMRTVYAVVQDSEDKILYNGTKTTNGGVVVTKKSALLGLAEYKSAVLVKKSDSSISKINNKNCACECEARVRAFMRMLRDEEGVAGEIGYETLCGGESFIKNYGKNWDDHPQIKVYIKRINDYSSAAGAYQVMGYTWNGMIEYRKKYNISNFNQENQDRFIVVLLKHKRFDPLPESVIKKYGEKFRNAHGHMIKMILTQNYNKLFLTASLEWASFPDSPYGQQRADYTIKEVKVKYDSYLNEELKGKSDLHIKKGFLQGFGYDCTCSGQNKKLSKQGYDINKAVSYIESHAESQSLSKCATYVRLAIEAGGLKSNAQPRNALNYFGILKQLGFKELQTTTYIKGDIVVFDAVTGHQYGHIAMWTGTEWISDFKQKSIIVNNAYNNGKSSIFRWE
ncbi:peptidoglycan amidohydrolase family protein [Flavobacterium nitrogenifigens]|uniref:Peptidoglycan hydrolase n=1 Tax=Flavobacterium nitrogenifigens TaxID=1617283 RepID=A0A521CLR7_9FLAO|nr:peptidoglycan amidohydrolase family protein [Flavobacterium nitrogenifigens]KAF2328460.1 hypothetical protein DM397_17990 [Flavobacterium nitrogenifigens]SMO60393.1 peptidoglycan hydrolase [Flavobacterium nitrogenifigens]